VLLSSGDNFPHLIQKRRSQLGFVTYLLNYPHTLIILAAFYTAGLPSCKAGETERQ